VIFGRAREVATAVTKRFWKRFAELIPLPRGRQLVTLEPGSRINPQRQYQA
jgi:hypothetical protein